MLDLPAWKSLFFRDFHGDFGFHGHLLFPRPCWISTAKWKLPKALSTKSESFALTRWTCSAFAKLKDESMLLPAMERRMLNDVINYWRLDMKANTLGKRLNRLLHGLAQSNWTNCPFLCSDLFLCSAPLFLFSVILLCLFLSSVLLFPLSFSFVPFLCSCALFFSSVPFRFVYSFFLFCFFCFLLVFCRPLDIELCLWRFLWINDDLRIHYHLLDLPAAAVLESLHV